MQLHRRESQILPHAPDSHRIIIRENADAGQKWGQSPQELARPRDLNVPGSAGHEDESDGVHA